MMRTHTCGELTPAQVGQEVELAGWVHSRRDLGGFVFIDLRDRYGLVQLAFDPEKNNQSYLIAQQLKNEWVVKIKGIVIARPESMVNKDMTTGGIEIQVTEAYVLNTCKPLPFEINNEEKISQVNEQLRLKNRFLDLRRPKLQALLEKKTIFIDYLRKYFKEQNFLEVQTPILANSSPEGARDFLIPSRLHPGKFYALPQAPQQFKQLLMISGLDRYFQIAPCFRDEDTRFDRAYGEFYQLDMEMSFVDQEDVFSVMEPLMINLTKEFSSKKIINLKSDNTFRRITWHDSMTKYGSDKPDLRFDCPIYVISDLVKDCEFSVFKDAIANSGVVHALRVDGGAKFSRKDIDELTEVAKKKQSKGLAYISLKEGGEISSSITKFLGEALVNKLIKETEAKTGDLILFAADTWRVVCGALGAVRNEAALRLGLKDDTKAAWCWVVDFPMYDYSDIEEGRIDFAHNPFSMPQGGLEVLKTKNPLDIVAFQYDLVLNGLEICSGAVRNHDPEIMYKAFEVAGYTKESVDEKFGAMIRAFEYGAPPHAGCAPGIDRLLMVLCDLESIRDIYAFPKDGQGKDVLMDSPSEVFESQLKDLKIKVDLK